MGHKHEFIHLRIVTYNVHKCRGLDGRIQPERVASVLQKLNPDVIALQEVVGTGPRGKGQEQEISNRLGMESVLAPARIFRGHLYGNALLTRFPIQGHTTFDLTQDRREPRFCQRVDLVLQGHRVQIYNVHLGTSRKERIQQANRLVTILADSGVRGPKIVLGDFNEWKKGPATKLFSEKLQSIDLLPFLRWRRTYPGILPLFHIDHIYYHGSMEFTKVEVPRTWSTLIASDHMPILAELRIRG